MYVCIYFVLQDCYVVPSVVLSSPSLVTIISDYAVAYDVSLGSWTIPTLVEVRVLCGYYCPSSSFSSYLRKW